jgi:hypothetical protein
MAASCASVNQSKRPAGIAATLCIVAAGTCCSLPDKVKISLPNLNNAHVAFISILRQNSPVAIPF